MSSRKKPTPLEWQGGLTGETDPKDSKQVVIRGETQASPAKAPSPIRAISGEVHVYRESKGRSGHPVLILKEFSDRNTTPESLKTLCTELKTKMACGGSSDHDSIILQTTQVDRLLQVLTKLNLLGKKRF